MTARVRLKLNTGQIRASEKAGAVKGLTEAAEYLLGESRKRVPIQEGTLERSGVASVDEERLRAAVSYDTVYAVRQHEELTWRHDPGRTAKYLEGPLNEGRSTIREIIGAALRRSLR